MHNTRRDFLKVSTLGGAALTLFGFDLAPAYHPINRGTLCPKGASLEQDILNERRLLKPQVRRPGSDHWEDIGWNQAIDEIGHWIKKTRDNTFVEKDGQGRTVNHCDSLAFIGGCTDTNEFNYLVVKTMRALGLLYIENQARV
jgi:formate dehydrogenase major subunit